MSRRAQITAALTLGAALALSAGCSGTSTPSSTPTAAAKPVACASLFRVGAPVAADLATKPCTNALGLVSAQHFMACHDGRRMIFDRDSNTYGFPGGTFATSDSDANSQYAHDFAACLG